MRFSRSKKWFSKGNTNQEPFQLERNWYFVLIQSNPVGLPTNLIQVVLPMSKTWWTIHTHLSGVKLVEAHDSAYAFRSSKQKTGHRLTGVLIVKQLLLVIQNQTKVPGQTLVLCHIPSSLVQMQKGLFRHQAETHNVNLSASASDCLNWVPHSTLSQEATVCVPSQTKLAVQLQ